MRRYEPQTIEPKWQEIVAPRARLQRRQPWRGRRARVGGQDLRPRDAPVPLRRAAHGPRAQLHARRDRRALPAAERLRGAAPHGLRRLRPAGRERRDPRGRPSARRDRAQHRGHPRADGADGLGDRLGPRPRHARARVLPLDAMAVPPLLRARARVPQRGAGQVVPERPDRARERAGDRRAVRALRRRGRGQEPGAVVLPHHRLRGRPARRDGAARVLAGARPHDAAQLDRPLGGRRALLPRGGARRRHPGLHDAARHDLRRHLLRPRAGASARPRARRGGRTGGGGARVRPPLRGAVGRRARGEGEGRRLHRPLRDEPGDRRADPDLGRRLRAHGVRHGRDHGRPGARRARPRVRGALRPADRDGRRARRRRRGSRCAERRVRRAFGRGGARQLG